jgi:hypothetical protein
MTCHVGKGYHPYTFPTLPPTCSFSSIIATLSAPKVPLRRMEAYPAGHTAYGVDNAPVAGPSSTKTAPTQSIPRKKTAKPKVSKTGPLLLS